jgi:uncharacterized 2Fe-2S/4Fe-4S cluster protein (DUF4445 family)
MSEVEIVFTPSGRRGRFQQGTALLDAARALGVDLDTVCGGRGICGRCQVMMGSQPGIPANPHSLSDPDTTETDYRGKRPLAEGHRLGCSARALADVVVDVPPESQVHKQVVRKRAGVESLPVDPVVRLHYVTVEEPDLSSPTGDLERLLAALADQWALTGLSVEPTVLPGLQTNLRAGGWSVTAAVREGTRLMAVFPGFRDAVFGVAFDVGSTTIAGHLCNLDTGAILASAGRMNPQIGFGEDLMSRVSYIMMNPGGEVQLTTIVRQALDALIGELCAESGIDRSEIVELAVVGNPIMHHLVLGIDPRELGTAPFALATTAALHTPASLLDLEVHPGAMVYTLPCIAGHVGADAAGATLSEGPHRGDALTLVVDVGTNAEIVLGNRRRLLAASSPTGPAFEGASISSGQRAAPGAIERVRIDRVTREARFKVIGSELWSDEPGFTEDISKTGVTGICGSGIIEVVAELFLAGVITSDGVISNRSGSRRVVANERTFSFRLWDDPVIEITQNDVRAIQLAKAALHAGCRLLMDRLGVDTVDSIRLAGAFGTHIDPIHALVLGMVPDVEPDRVTAAGNAAGIGAMMALLSGDSRAEIERVARTIEKVETATEASFQEHFVAAMGLPHKTDPYSRLGSSVDLPPPTTADTNGRPGRRRNREDQS